MVRLSGVLCLLLVTVTAMGQSSQPSAVLIRNVRVANGEAGSPVNVAVLIVNGHANRMAVNDPIPSGAVVIDGGGSLMTLGADGEIKLKPIGNVVATDQRATTEAVIRTASLTKDGSPAPEDVNVTRRTSEVVTAQQPAAQTTSLAQKVDSAAPDLTQQAADPTAPLMAFNFKNEYVSSFYGVPGGGNAFTFQPVIPFRAWKQSHLLRTTVSYGISGPGERGLASVSIFDLIVLNKKWGRWGVGPLVQFSRNRGPGTDTATAGPAIGFVARKGKWNLGLFNQNLFGHHTRFSSVQPVIAYVLQHGWALSSGDAQWSIDWTEPQFVNIPLGVQVSKVTKLGGQPVKYSFNPEYNARSVNGAPHWSFRFLVTILAPVKAEK